MCIRNCLDLLQYCQKKWLGQKIFLTYKVFHFINLTFGWRMSFPNVRQWPEEGTLEHVLHISILKVMFSKRRSSAIVFKNVVIFTNLMCGIWEMSYNIISVKVLLLKHLKFYKPDEWNLGHVRANPVLRAMLFFQTLKLVTVLFQHGCFHLREKRLKRNSLFAFSVFSPGLSCLWRGSRSWSCCRGWGRRSPPSCSPPCPSSPGQVRC